MKSILTANEQWLKNLEEVTRNGKAHSPRGRMTVELVGYRSMIDMRYPVITVPGRKMGHKFMVAEALWILNGDNSLAGIGPYAKAIKEFSDDGYRFQGAYGPKVTEQLRYVCDTLTEDPESRQAVINIWRENPRKSRDIPCTLSLQFLIRDGKIHTIATMRSSDLWLGWVYDVFNFTMVTAWVALRIKEMKYLESNWQPLQLGTLTIQAGSQHLYIENFDAACVCMSQDPFAGGSYPLDLSKFNAPNDLMIHLQSLRDTSGIMESLPFSQLFLSRGHA